MATRSIFGRRARPEMSYNTEPKWIQVDPSGPKWYMTCRMFLFYSERMGFWDILGILGIRLCMMWHCVTFHKNVPLRKHCRRPELTSAWHVCRLSGPWLHMTSPVGSKNLYVSVYIYISWKSDNYQWHTGFVHWFHWSWQFTIGPYWSSDIRRSAQTEVLPLTLDIFIGECLSLAGRCQTQMYITDSVVVLLSSLGRASGTVSFEKSRMAWNMTGIAFIYFLSFLTAVSAWAYAFDGVMLALEEMQHCASWKHLHDVCLWQSDLPWRLEQPCPPMGGPRKVPLTCVVYKHLSTCNIYIWSSVPTPLPRPWSWFSNSTINSHHLPRVWKSSMGSSSSSSSSSS